MKAKTSSKQSESVHNASPSALKGESKGSFFSFSERSKNTFFGPSAIQPKLEIGQPNDKYEQEADRVADTVMRMPDPQIQRRPVEEEEEELQMKRENTLIQRKCKGCEEEGKLQKKPDGKVSSVNHANSNISSQLASQAGAGNRLPKPVRSEMTHKMGADFSGVNIHTDPAAHKLNRHLGARAFTHGSDIYFNKGEYNPDSSEGKHLLVHELTHVVQQKGDSQNKIQRIPLYSDCREPVKEMQYRGYCPELTREENELEYYERIGPDIQQTGLNCWLVMNLRSGSSYLGQQEELRSIVTLLTVIDPTSEATITGYTDCISETGPELNRSLRFQRANSVEQMLIDMGVHEDQLWIEAASPDEYVASNSTSLGRAMNRGVVISISTNINLAEVEEEGEIETEEPEGGDPCAPISMDLPSFISSQIQLQRRQLDTILNLIDRKVGHIALGIQVTGSAEAGMGAGGAVDIVGVVNAETAREVEFEVAGSGQLSTGAGGGVSVRMLAGYNIIPINEDPGSHDFGRHGLVYGLSGSYVVGAGVSVSDTLILDIFDEQDQRGWVVFTLGAGAEAEIEGSVSYGSSATELCELQNYIISQIFD